MFHGGWHTLRSPDRLARPTEARLRSGEFCRSSLTPDAQQATGVKDTVAAPSEKMGRFYF